MAKEYRDLASEIPTEAFFGDELAAEKYKDKLDEFYHYFDLCNSQTFLRQEGRVRGRTWKFWCDGMKSNFKRKAFAKAWDDISSRAKDDFSELRRLILSEFEDDPKKWGKPA